jgi:tol-pal system-associated acyl-CoA thioesterase
MEHRVAYKVYYEDTDSLGVVYYANYLKFLERGRTEWVGAQGKPIQEWNHEGYYFVVYGLTMKFKQSAALGDVVEVVTGVQMGSPYRARFLQRIECRGAVLVEAEVEIVCTDRNQRLQEFPRLTAE